MRNLLYVALLLLVSNTAIGFTWPEAFPYDGLLSNESVDIIGLANAWHIRGGIQYMGITNRYFNEDSRNVSDYPEAYQYGYNTRFDDYGNSRAVIPFMLGYNMMSIIRIDLTLQLVRYYWAEEWVPIGTSNITEEMGIGDIWIAGRGIFSEGDGWYLVPRAAIKFNLGGDNTYISDEQVDFDIAAQFGKPGGYGWFRGVGSIGFRYRLSENRKTDTGSETVKPGAMMYLTLDPGAAIFPGFEVYLPINALYYTDEVVDGDRKEGTSGNGISVGLKPRYLFNRNVALDAHFIIPILGKKINNEVLIGLNAEVYAPL